MRRGRVGTAVKKLAPLEIVGKVNVCSPTVRIRNQVIGAEVYVNFGNTYIGGGTATFSNQSFPLIPDLIQTLTDKKIAAIQMLSGWDPSDPSASVTVGGEPTKAALSEGKFFKPFHVCSAAVALVGLVPGATVEVSSKKGESLGKAQVTEHGVVQVDLKRNLTGQDDLVAIQTSCKKIKGMAIAGGPPQPVPSALPAPALDDLWACGQFLHLTKVVPGAQVTLKRNGTVFMEFRSAVPDFPIYPIAPLKGMDTIAASQDFPACFRFRHDPWPESTTVVHDGAVDAPKILTPLCEGQKFVAIGGPQAGATVELTVGTDVFAFGANAPTFKCSVPPLKVVPVSARQTLCAPNWSQPSQTKQVGSSAPQVPTLVSPAPSGMTKLSLTPKLAWKDPGALCNKATRFDVELSIDPTVKSDGSFTKVEQKKPGLLVPFWTPAMLQPGKKYHWHVRAHVGSSKVSPWSTDPATKLPWIFTTAMTETPVDPPAGPYDTDPRGKVKHWYFIQDCCPFNRKLVTPNIEMNFADSLHYVITHAPASCAITPEVAYKKGFKPGTCDTPNW